MQIQGKAAALRTLGQRFFLDPFLSPRRFLQTMRDFRVLSDMLVHAGVGSLQISQIPAPDERVQMMATDPVHGGMPPQDLYTVLRVLRWIQPRRVFEIGTFNGVTTAHLAMNSDAEIYTLDLPRELASSADLGHYEPSGAALLQAGENIGGAYRRVNGNSSGRIRQLFGDSRTFDYSPYLASMQLVIVDACHLFDYVTADSQSALRLLGARGAILWHDFGNSNGVTRACKLLAKSIPIFHIEGTWLALHVRGISHQLALAPAGKQLGEQSHHSLEPRSC